MAIRRVCRLADAEHRNVDLRQYERLIVDTINQIVPNKNPQVSEHYFCTDRLTQSEAVAIGRALSKLSELKQYGKTVTTFRLFDGKIYESKEQTETAVNQTETGE